jgi:RNA recognition motif-containing protein
LRSLGSWVSTREIIDVFARFGPLSNVDLTLSKFNNFGKYLSKSQIISKRYLSIFPFSTVLPVFSFCPQLGFITFENAKDAQEAVEKLKHNTWGFRAEMSVQNCGEEREDGEINHGRRLPRGTQYENRNRKLRDLRVDNNREPLSKPLPWPREFSQSPQPFFV